MSYLFLTIVVVLITTQSIAKKQYNLKVKQSNSFLFSAIAALFALIVFLITAKFKLDLSLDLVPYSIGFAVSYASALVGTLLAIMWGPLSITLLINSYSLIIPTLYGLIALDEKFTAVKILGLVLLALSLLLISTVLERKGNPQQRKFSLKWLMALILGFTGNGICSTVQKMQQISFFGQFKSEFMVIALVIVVITLTIAAIINREDLRIDTMPCVTLAAISGIANGIVNLLVMVLSAPGGMEASILFPSMSGGGIVLGLLLSIFVYKEKLSALQYLGYAMGTASVILLNI